MAWLAEPRPSDAPWRLALLSDGPLLFLPLELIIVAAGLWPIDDQASIYFCFE